MFVDDVKRSLLKPGPPGQDGVSPSISITAIDGGHRITITDAEGEKSVDIMDGAKGDKGDPGDKGNPGEKGDPGQKGDTGPAGPVSVAVEDVSRNVEIFNSDGSSYYKTIYDHNVTFTNSDGSTTSFTIADGTPGDPGANGQDGMSPGPAEVAWEVVNGTDIMTQVAQYLIDNGYVAHS